MADLRIDNLRVGLEEGTVGWYSSAPAWWTMGISIRGMGRTLLSVKQPKLGDESAFDFFGTGLHIVPMHKMVPDSMRLVTNRYIHTLCRNRCVYIHAWNVKPGSRLYLYMKWSQIPSGNILLYTHHSGARRHN